MEETMRRLMLTAVAMAVPAAAESVMALSAEYVVQLAVWGKVSKLSGMPL